MPAGSKGETASRRDVRLDFFRGIGMFIIFIAHVPRNPWNDWIPARFGFSDATEIFVFCSGMASGMAFASVFDKGGFLLGCARVLHRCWQVYWAHIGLFISCVALMILADHVYGTGSAFANSLNVSRFLNEDTDAGLLGLLTLTYVPNLFDILPMYLVILTFIPIVMALARVHSVLPLAFCAVLWFFATQGYLQLPAEPWSDRTWYFDPFAWQLVFFTGFAFVRGWLPAPEIEPRLVGLAATIVGAAMVLSLPSLRGLLPESWTAVPYALVDKTNFGFLRYVHFLALAYLAFAAAGPSGDRLTGGFVDICRRVGQQALAVFVAGIVFSLMGGIFLTVYGYTWATVTIVNLAGFVALVGVAYTVSWFKRTPWKVRTVTPQRDHQVAQQARGNAG